MQAATVDELLGEVAVAGGADLDGAVLRLNVCHTGVEKELTARTRDEFGESGANLRVVDDASFRDVDGADARRGGF